MNKNTANDVEIWLVYRPNYLQEGFVEIKSWMSDNPNQKFIEKEDNNKTKPINNTNKSNNSKPLNSTSIESKTKEMNHINLKT